MQRLTNSAFHELLAPHKILVDHKLGPKVLLTEDNCILKVFYPREGLSSDKIFPYAKRFIKNSKKLAKKQIGTVEIIKSYYCPDNGVYILKYPCLPGGELRDKPELLTEFAKFLAKLHQKGIFFRGIHLGNILWTGEQFCLIDITDLKTKAHSLSVHLRYRNLKHLLFYRTDKKQFADYGIREFLQVYFNEAKLGAWQRGLLRYLLIRDQQHGNQASH